MGIGITHVAAEQQDGVIQNRAVAVGRLAQAVKEFGKYFGVVCLYHSAFIHLVRNVTVMG